ncbi:MAG: hypothetical protein ACRD0W_00940 [Acidimicrobiales bacterium]
MADARFTKQVVALIDEPTRAQIDRIADHAGVPVSVVVRAAFRHGLGLAEREAQRGKLRDA